MKSAAPGSETVGAGCAGPSPRFLRASWLDSIFAGGLHLRFRWFTGQFGAFGPGVGILQLLDYKLLQLRSARGQHYPQIMRTTSLSV
jgi:hypothetical protein